ncbi:MAG: efflux RND transporter periplasmic adaptor subunit [Planctomycetes bacterium]|nr:efflux RND transporter periplasmic adaptor subunit [Planctomycetota bacterium]
MSVIPTLRLASMVFFCAAFVACGWAEDDDDATSATPTARPEAQHVEGKPVAKNDVDAQVDHVALSPEVIAHYHVTTGSVKRLPLTPPIIAAAEVGFDSDQVMDIGTLAAGRVQAIKARVGDVVAQGDILMTIDSQELGQAQNIYIERLGARAAAQADAGLALATWTRSQPLMKDQSISSAEASRRESDMRKTESAVQAAEAALIGAENSLRLYGVDDTGITELKSSRRVSPQVAIRAPAAGTVIARSVTLGEIVRPDQEALFVIADLTEVWVTASVPVAGSHQVVVGQPTRITTAGIAQPVEGRIAFVPPALDSQSRTLPVRITVPWTSGLRPGMFATVSIDVTDAHAPEMTVVPSDAVFSYASDRVVFMPVPETPGSFRVRRVVTGPPEGDLTPVISGVAEGDTIVVTGGFIIKAQLAKGPADED